MANPFPSPRASRAVIAYGLMLALLLILGIALPLARPARPNLRERGLGSLGVVVGSSGGQFVYAPYGGEAPPPGTRPYANVDMTVTFASNAKWRPWLRRYSVEYELWVRKYSMPFDLSLEPIRVDASDSSLVEHYAAGLKDPLLHRVAAGVALQQATAIAPKNAPSGMAGVSAFTYSGTLVRWDAIAYSVGVALWLFLLVVVATAAARRVVRYRRRIARYRCPACDYDLTGIPNDAPCPECGGTPLVAGGRPPPDSRTDRPRMSGPARGAILASLVIFALALAATQTDEVYPTLIETFGARPLGLPVVLYASSVESVLFLPIPWVLWHLGLISDRAHEDGDGLGRAGILWHCLTIGERHLYLRRSQAVVFAGLAYYILIAGAWIAYAALRGV